MTELMEYTFYVEGKPPEAVEGAEIIAVEKLFKNWHKLVLRFPKNKLTIIVEKLRKSGVRLARSANYPLV